MSRRGETTQAIWRNPAYLLSKEVTFRLTKVHASYVYWSRDGSSDAFHGRWASIGKPSYNSVNFPIGYTMGHYRHQAQLAIRD